MTADYFRALASRCRTSARSCFDLYAQEEFGRLAREFDTRARELDGPAAHHWSGVGLLPRWRGYPGGYEGDR
jgi:hypothetical protein